jgi:exonuclease VII small subunit
MMPPAREEDPMSFMDNLKDLAENAQDKLETAQGIFEQVEKYLPEARRDQVETFLEKAQDALALVTGDKPDEKPEAPAEDNG